MTNGINAFLFFLFACFFTDDSMLHTRRKSSLSLTVMLEGSILPNVYLCRIMSGSIMVSSIDEMNVVMKSLHV